MKLFLTIEIQHEAEQLSRIMWEVTQQLNFVTDRNSDLENIDNYGTEFNTIAIIPTCVSDKYWKGLEWKERVLIRRKKKDVDIRLRMDYERFINETKSNQRLMFIAIIVDSINIIQQKSKVDFRGDKLVADILKALDVTPQMLDGYMR